MNYKYIIDRVEGNYVIAEKENGDMCEITLETIKGTFKEGDILLQKGQYFKVDEELTKERKRMINNKINDMWE